MAHKVKLHLCLAVGSYFKHGGACSSSPSTFRTGIALYEAHSNANYFLTAVVLPDQLEKEKSIYCFKCAFSFCPQVLWQFTLPNRPGVFPFRYLSLWPCNPVRRQLPWLRKVLDLNTPPDCGRTQARTLDDLFLGEHRHQTTSTFSLTGNKSAIAFPRIADN